uniref:Uncharacterized protein n=1 Tax=Mycena chlorophos TaxID=658473 RepID=A0ABQ0L5Z2_MYCCL|nr:predicted protein [Mycena chlorophos]
MLQRNCSLIHRPTHPKLSLAGGVISFVLTRPPVGAARHDCPPRLPSDRRGAAHERYPLRSSDSVTFLVKNSTPPAFAPLRVPQHPPEPVRHQ